jgi:hypothetical protein
MLEITVSNKNPDFITESRTISPNFLFWLKTTAIFRQIHGDLPQKLNKIGYILLLSRHISGYVTVFAYTKLDGFFKHLSAFK